MSTQTNPSAPTTTTPPTTTTNPALQTQTEGVVDQAMTTDGFKDDNKTAQQPVEEQPVDEAAAKAAGDDNETQQQKDCCSIGGVGAASKLRGVFSRSKGDEGDVKGEEVKVTEGK
ncbi:hypothetical protein RRF57_011255 [Xylaria bambusicola]|uniref:Uncharacterized protein n=1 Tax=Xylaria bambusicola TaxID=326684 RepID=A0AAN7ZE05_9PEZI